MLKKGQIVEVFEDPLTRMRKEGNAKVVGHELELDPGVNLYKVCFVGDDPEMILVRKIVEDCICCDPLHSGDDPNCPVHGKVSNVTS